MSSPITTSPDLPQPPQWNNSRGVVERIFVAGRLVLETPAHFGNGDAGGTTDIPLLFDAVDPQRPLLTGASIAGALRNYLREYEHGYGWAENRAAPHPRSSRAERLFGRLDDSQPERRAAWQSWLMVDDALGQPPAWAATEIRDGVTINPRTRTAEVEGVADTGPGHERVKGKKYDIELLAAGTTFDLGFEFCWTNDNQDLLEALAVALDALEQGMIGLGMRKRRGYGQCRVTGCGMPQASVRAGSVSVSVGTISVDVVGSGFVRNILDALKVTPPSSNARRFSLTATFEVDHSFLIRSESGTTAAPDMVHLQSWRNGQLQPILSGTSLAGSIRGRALRIANTLRGPQVGSTLVDSLFGRRIEEEIAASRGVVDGRDTQDDHPPTGSRLVVREVVVQGGTRNLVQGRVKLDRFTGGAYPQALFSQQPIFSTPAQRAQVKVELSLRQPFDALTDDRKRRNFEAEIGLLLLVLKDLWTGDLPLGGEASVGRGRLRGVEAELGWGEKTWTLRRAGDNTRLTVEGGEQAKQELQGYVDAIKEWADDTANR